MSDKIDAAGLGVYEEETEYFFEDLSAQVLNDDVFARRLTFSNVLIPSQQGFFTPRETIENIVHTALENICGGQAFEKKRSGKCFR